MKLLHVDSSILGDQSVSRIVTADVVAAETRRHPGLEVVHRDLGRAPVPHLSGAFVAAMRGPAADAVPSEFADEVAVLDEFLAADIVVIGAPMYNFGVSSQLKAWIDRLAVPGKTFRYTETGPEGLLHGKRVVVVSTRGGKYGADTALATLDHQETYLTSIFGFFGVTDLAFVRAEGLAMGPEARDAAIAGAKADAERLAA